MKITLERRDHPRRERCLNTQSSLSPLDAAICSSSSFITTEKHARNRTHMERTPRNRNHRLCPLGSIHSDPLESNFKMTIKDDDKPKGQA